MDNFSVAAMEVDDYFLVMQMIIIVINPDRNFNSITITVNLF